MRGHFIGIALLTIIIMVVGAFGIHIAGSPTENRNVRYDEIRLRDLDTITTAVSSYYQDNYKLPTTVSQLSENRVKTQMPYLKKQPKDPKTKSNYSYRVVSTTSYELCATFDTSSEVIAQRKTGTTESLSEYSSYYGEDRSHPKGQYCFTKKTPYVERQSVPDSSYNYEELYPQATASAF